jgi:hypothetical protein
MFNKILKLYRLIFARKIFYKLNKALYQMSLRGLGVLNYESHKVSGETFFLSKKYAIFILRWCKHWQLLKRDFKFVV